MGYEKILILVAVGMATILAIIMYLNYMKKTPVIEGGSSIKNHVPEEPVLVDENYLIAQSGLTKEQYYERMALYEQRRKERAEEFKNKGKKNPKRERSVDDELGMSF